MTQLVVFLAASLAFFSVFLTIRRKLENPTDLEVFDVITLPLIWVASVIFLVYSNWFFLFYISLSTIFLMYIAEFIDKEDNDFIVNCSSFSVFIILTLYFGWFTFIR